ncbi:polyprenyl synthetase family protein [Actinomadura barringtoniae]|uniref:Polyprenyl synthetase family protein n=2 Tax=Actinomadura barringtoniae TaxID=1427535 RepID=A0A939T3A0_9ACTN|nr:polyprenyl synthetase family protein [Actinomadura barringtoniae]
MQARLAELAAGLPEPLGGPARELAGNPGKCLRGTLLAACAGFGPPDPERTAGLGALVELIHLATLMHDDVIDRAAQRRGRPAAHTVVGGDVAMLSGLACLALAGTRAADEGLELAVSRTVSELAYGELLDVERAFDTGLPLPDYEELIARKTGELFRLGCALGAAVAGLDIDAVRALGDFGMGFGMAFQILDDCLDLDGASSGKPLGTDHLLGLFGAPTLCALRRDGSGELTELLLSPSFGIGDLPRLRLLVAERGGLAEAYELAARHRRRAMEILDGMPYGPARRTLVQVADSAWSPAA